MVPVNRSSGVPLHKQLYDGLREAIFAGRFPAGARLPSTRGLAVELGVSRNTITGAFSQLLAEGYLEGRVGSGTFVAGVLPDEMLKTRRGSRGFGIEREETLPSSGRRLSRRGELLAATQTVTVRDMGRLRAFRPCVPALDEFPIRKWRLLASRRLRRSTSDLLGYGDPAGYLPLREAIAGYLGAARAVRCSPEQVVVVSGSQQALDLVARVLLDPGEAAWVEDPGYSGARAALVGAGARLVPVPVDEEGLDVSAGIEREAGALLAYVTPSHQYPLGPTMGLARRLELLRWASGAGAWIVEDDYDGEYRYSGRPLEALQGLDAEGRVIYVGTFSKVLFPALRLGYLVVPPDLTDTFVAARELSDRHAPVIEQAVLTDFITEGHFARHVRRMRTLYASRQEALVDAAKKELDGLIDVSPAEAGMHLVGFLPEGSDDHEASRMAAAHGVEAPPISSYALEPLPGRPSSRGLLLGYAAFTEPEILRGIRQLATALG